MGAATEGHLGCFLQGLAKKSTAPSSKDADEKKQETPFQLEIKLSSSSSSSSTCYCALSLSLSRSPLASGKTYSNTCISKPET